MDNLTKEQRTRCMTRIRSKDTMPELAVRSAVHRLGYRFRLHRADLPGCPDIVLPGPRTIIMVHGCFWHLHWCRRGAVAVATNETYWESKRQANAARDRANTRKLRRLGWEVLVVWECWTKHPKQLERRLRRYLAG